MDFEVDLYNRLSFGKDRARNKERENNFMELIRYTTQIRCRDRGCPRELENVHGRNARSGYFPGPVLDEGEAVKTAFAEETGRQQVSPTACAKEEGSVSVGSSAVNVRRAIDFAMPSLKGKKIRIVRILPAILPTQVSLHKRPYKKDLRQPEAAPTEVARVVEVPQAVPIKVIPESGVKTRRRAEPREEPSPPIETKRLKVIRRRREEAPKVFETAPMAVPKAMLAGVKISDNDATDNND